MPGAARRLHGRGGGADEPERHNHDANPDVALEHQLPPAAHADLVVTDVTTGTALRIANVAGTAVTLSTDQV